MTVEEAAKLMTPEAYAKLDELVTVKPTIDVGKKAGNDILMSAFCKAIENEVIKITSIDDRLTKLLNSATNTLSQEKLKYLLRVVHQKQPLTCVVSIMTQDMTETIKVWELNNPDEIDFLEMFKWCINEYDITPSSIRTKLADILKPTIVNNISQLVSRVQNGVEDDIVISITTITRIINACDKLIYATFKAE